MKIVHVPDTYRRRHAYLGHLFMIFIFKNFVIIFLLHGLEQT